MGTSKVKLSQKQIERIHQQMFEDVARLVANMQLLRDAEANGHGIRHPDLKGLEAIIRSTKRRNTNGTSKTRNHSGRHVNHVVMGSAEV